MDEKSRTEATDERRDYEAPELTVLASVEEATLMSQETGSGSDGQFFSGQGTF
jgi:hypothetical protein